MAEENCEFDPTQYPAPGGRTKEEFIQDIQRELSVSCALPFTIPVDQIELIIKNTADWFYRYYEDSVEERYYAIPKTIFDDPRFKKDRTIILPECIYAVWSLKKLREDFGRSLSYDGTADFGIERLFLSDSISLGQGTENLMYYTMQMYWLDVANSMINHTVSYNYNRNTHKLVILGQTPDKDIVLGCQTKVPLEYLMNDIIFYRYVVAKAKTQISRMLGTFNFNLVGGVTINFDMIREEGKEELDKIIEEIKSDNTQDFFFTTGGV